jgi:hypothetical protein
MGCHRRTSSQGADNQHNPTVHPVPADPPRPPAFSAMALGMAVMVVMAAMRPLLDMHRTRMAALGVPAE